MNKKNLILASLLITLPVLSFASTGGDTTFDKITAQLTAYLGGSLGMVFVLIGFLGAAAAIAGFASMKVMFPVFGLTLALRYGPEVLSSVFSADGSTYLHHTNDITFVDLAILLASAALLVIAFNKKSGKKVNA